MDLKEARHLGCEGVKFLRRQNKLSLFSGLGLKVVQCLGSRAHCLGSRVHCVGSRAQHVGSKWEEPMVYDGVSSGDDV
jgi:hypothetical protein